MQINLTKRIVVLTWLICSYSMVNAQSWSKSFTAGGYDSNNTLLGGSEVLQLVDHKSMLFASIGYWQDGNNIWYGGFNNNIGWGQVNRLDSPNGDWKEDLFMGGNYLRPEILKQVIFTKDQFGASLSVPDTVLICSGYSPNYITNVVTVESFVRDDVSNTWEESFIMQGSFPAGENYSVRDIQVYTDKQTGLEYVFATIGTQGIYKGKYNPSTQGKIDWIATPEYGPLNIRPLGIVEANDTLYFSSGDKLYKRIDGVSPTYAVAHDFSDLGAIINSAVGGIRGLTTIKNPSNNSDALLMIWCPNGQSQGVIYRLEADGTGGLNRVYETKLSVLIEGYLPGTSADYVLGAYNEFYEYIDPISNDTLHIVGFEASINGGGYPTWNGYYSGALFAKRDAAGQYAIEEVNGVIGQTDTALVANRCYVKSPFTGENSLYFGGFDPNGNAATNMAWVFKKDYLANSIDETQTNENSFFVYPNPSSNQLFIKSENLEDHDYNIINSLGKNVATGKINGPTEAVDISSLPPNVYILRVANESYKFIKPN